jgi:Flp pilus assembly protein TadG
MGDSRVHRQTSGERGQVLVIFTLALLGILGVVGLAVDGGSTFAQRRNQQGATDLAALAAANDYLINGNLAQAVARGRTIAAANAFTHGVAGTSVDVSIDTSNGARVTVVIGSPPVVGVVGFPAWQVTTEAEALAGFPDTAYGASPFIFAASAFEDDGTPRYQTATDFGEGNGDVPNGPQDFAWTNYGTGNVSSSDVSAIISGATVIDKTIQFGEYIGQHNNGNHSTLFSDVDTYLSGAEVPAAVVDANGNFVGWSTFHVISASGGSSKHVTGYFVSSFTSARLSVTVCSANNCPRYLGTYVLKLSN